MITNYQELPIREEMKKAIAEMGFTEMTEIQQKAIPELLAGKEVIAKAPTGTGKTCAFGVPMVQRIQPEKGAVPDGHHIVGGVGPQKAPVRHGNGGFGNGNVLAAHKGDPLGIIR